MIFNHFISRVLFKATTYTFIIAYDFLVKIKIPPKKLFMNQTSFENDKEVSLEVRPLM